MIELHERTGGFLPRGLGVLAIAYSLVQLGPWASCPSAITRIGSPGWVPEKLRVGRL